MKATMKDMKMLGRLKRRSDFLRVQGTGRKWVSPTVIVYRATGGQDQGETRFGLTVTKKTAKKAVDRNRIRRRLRAAACDILSTRPELGGQDFVLIGRPATQTAPYEKLTGDLRWCLKRLAQESEKSVTEEKDAKL